VKIALLIPIHSGAKPAFTECLGNLIAATTRADINVDGKKTVPEIETMVVSLSTISLARGALFDRAERWGADFSLWMDSDHVFPRDALLRLLAHQKPVVGCNISQRQFEGSTAVAGGERVVPAAGLQQVDANGLGLCLVDMRVLDKLKRHAEATATPLLPLFREVWAEGPKLMGEDFYFCNRLTAAGVPIFIDHDLSRQVGHIDETIRYLPRA
jgi:hypothetical protein